MLAFLNFSKTDRDYLLRKQIDIVEFFQKILIKGIDSGEFAIHNPLFVAHNILMLGHVWETRRWFLRKNFTLGEYTNELIDFILNAICKNGH